MITQARGLSVISRQVLQTNELGLLGDGRDAVASPATPSVGLDQQGILRGHTGRCSSAKSSSRINKPGCTCTTSTSATGDSASRTSPSARLRSSPNPRSWPALPDNPSRSPAGRGASPSEGASIPELSFSKPEWEKYCRKASWRAARQRSCAAPPAKMGREGSAEPGHPVGSPPETVLCRRRSADPVEARRSWQP